MIQAFFLQNKDIKELFNTGNKELQLVDQWLIANRLSVNDSTKLNTFYLRLLNPN